MTKIQFTLDAWLKDKSQKVETRDGRIVHNIWRVKEPFYTNNRKAEVCALIDGEEDALVFFEGGKYLPTTEDTDSPFDIFIITQEKELTKWEKAIKDLVLAIDEGELRELGVFEEENLGAWAVKKAGELLELAKDEIYSHESLAEYAKKAKAEGKTEALKDLPRWKKANKTCYVGDSIIIDEYGYYRSNTVKRGGHYILISDIEKLPGFRED